MPSRTARRTAAGVRGIKLKKQNDEVAGFIADRVTDSVRALEAALIRVAAYASLQGRPVDVALTRDVLDKFYPDSRRAASTSVQSIQESVAQAYGITVDELVSGGRSARIAWPRQVAMYLCREHTSQSLPAIGRAFGGRDHSTVMYANRKAAERLARDREQAEIVRRLTEQILSGHDDRGN